MSLRFRYLFLSFFLICNVLKAQETSCDNCIDDDGDGLIDCYDSDCFDNANCEGIYLNASNGIGNSSCQNFILNELWTIPGSYGTQEFVVGDVDRDGFPEVLIDEFVYDGRDRSIKTITSANVSNTIIGDVDNDGDIELFYLESFTFNRYEYGSTTPTWTANNFELDNRFAGIADFDMDGIAEIYSRTSIASSSTGAIIVNGVSFYDPQNFTYSYAADILPDSFCDNCAGLEILYGDKVFSVDISSGQINVESEKPLPSLTKGASIPVDFNLDGLLDVIVSAEGQVYVFDPRTSELLGDVYLKTTVVSPNSLDLPLVANFDADPEPEIAIENSRDAYFVLDNDMTLLWENPNLSDPTNSPYDVETAFDLDCDGILEIIHKSGDGFLDIVDGRTGTILQQVPCFSSTSGQQPIVADLNADGYADILCGCSDGIKAFSGAPNNWASSRQVWNQYHYNPTHINDDLTIPCGPGEGYPEKLPNQLNSFYVQAPLYNGKGEACFADPTVRDMSLTIDSIYYSSCDSVEIYLNICNNSQDSIVPANTPISFYKDIKYNDYDLVKTIPLGITLTAGECIQKQVTIPATDNNIRIWANDDGSDDRRAPTATVEECYFPNNVDTVNIQAQQIPPFELGSDIDTCFETTVILSVDSFPNITYNWSTGDTTTQIAVFKPGLYYVELTSKDECSESDSLHINSEGCNQQVYIPNAFTPDGDGYQDDWGVFVLLPPEVFFVAIYNRFGELVYESDDVSFRWSGVGGSQLMLSGVYTYRMQVDDKMYTGNISLLR